MGGTYDKLYKEVPTYKLITPSIVSERLKVRGSLARRALLELESKNLIKLVVAHSSQMIYTRMIGDAPEDEKENEGGVVVEKKGKGKKDKAEAKSLAKAEKEAEAWFYGIEGLFRIWATFIAWKGLFRPLCPVLG